MLKEIFTAAVISAGALYPVAASADVITCKLTSHGVTGYYKVGGDPSAAVREVVGAGFQVDTAKPNILLVKNGESYYRLENVKVSQKSKFTLYKIKYSGRYQDTNQKFTYNYTYKIYKNGSAKAGMQQSPSSKYVYMEAKGTCDNV